METLKDYLETMFVQLPNTPEVCRAKDELWQMMEDKYTELKSEGKSENEAVGTVISEFGNLCDLAEDLGIGDAMQEADASDVELLALEDVKRYLSDSTRRAIYTGLGVLLCILSVCPLLLTPALALFMSALLSEEQLSAIGAGIMFLFIAVAVGLFVYSHVMFNRWGYLKKGGYRMDFAASAYVQQEYANHRLIHAGSLAIGVVLCVVSFVPAVLLNRFSSNNLLLINLSSCVLFLLAGIGVFYIVVASMRRGAIGRLLRLNGSGGNTGGSYTPSPREKAKPRYTNPKAAAVMSVYWITVTCVYLCWSFLTFDWGITWIIWPAAGIIRKLLNVLFREED